MKLQPYIALMRLDRPIGTLLLLWPTLIALWLAADAAPDFHVVAIFACGVMLMRAAGCVINDFADRNFDQHVTRTKNRPLATKQLTSTNALKLFATLVLLAFVMVLQLSIATILLASVALILAIAYPFAKRVTNYPQLVLGLAFAWSIPMAYSELHGKLILETWVLFASIVAWVVAYDTLYAMADIKDDLKIGIKSTAIAFGKYDKAIVLVLQLLCLLGFIHIGLTRSLASQFYVALSVAAGLALYQQWLIKDRLPQRCMAAFLNNNYFGMVIFLGLIASNKIVY